MKVRTRPMPERGKKLLLAERGTVRIPAFVLFVTRALGQHGLPSDVSDSGSDSRVMESAGTELLEEHGPIDDPLEPGQEQYQPQLPFPESTDHEQPEPELALAA